MLIDVFTFLFETEGNEEVKKSLNDLDESTKKTTDSSEKMGRAFAELTKALAPLVAGYTMLHEVMDFSKEAEQVGFLTNMTGLSANALDTLGFAAAQFGGNIQTASNAIMGLQRNIMQLRRTGDGALVQAGMMYGINISMDPEQMLKNIAKRMEGLTIPMQMDLGRMLGLDNSTIMMLQGGLESFTEELERAKKYSFLDDKMVKNARELMRVNRENAAIWDGLKNILMDYLSPFVITILENIRDIGAYLHDHKELVVGVAVGIGAIATALMPIEKIVMSIGAFIGGWGGVLAAIIASLTLIGEDLNKFLNGQDSLFGELIKEYPQVVEMIKTAIATQDEFLRKIESGEAWEALKKRGGEAWEALKELGASAIKDLINVFEKLRTLEVWGDLKIKITNMLDIFKMIYQTIKGSIMGALNELVNYDYSGNLMLFWKRLKTMIEETAAAISSFFDKYKGIIERAVELAGMFVAPEAVVGYELVKAAESASPPAAGWRWWT